MTTNVISGEQSNTKIVAIFKTKEAAEDCAKKIQEYGLDSTQFDIVSPTDRDYDRKLEPEGQGIKRTGIKAHATFGIIGFVIGLALWGAFYFMGYDLIKNTPIGSLAAFLFILTCFGLMMGGFITMRVDQQGVIQTVRTAVKEGNWSLLIHSRSHQQTQDVTQALTNLGIDSVRSL